MSTRSFVPAPTRNPSRYAAQPRTATFSVVPAHAGIQRLSTADESWDSRPRVDDEHDDAYDHHSSHGSNL